MIKNLILRILLIVLVVFEAISGLVGGFGLLSDPSGILLNIPIIILNQTPFSNFLIPGLILFIILGVFPVFIVYGLIAKPSWKWANILNVYKDQHWAWTYSIYLGIILALWIDFQIMFIGYGHFIQTFYALLGIVIIIMALVPSVRNYYSLKE